MKVTINRETPAPPPVQSVTIVLTPDEADTLHKISLCDTSIPNMFIPSPALRERVKSLLKDLQDNLEGVEKEKG